MYNIYVRRETFKYTPPQEFGTCCLTHKSEQLWDRLLFGKFVCVHILTKGKLKKQLLLLAALKEMADGSNTNNSQLRLVGFNSLLGSDNAVTCVLEHGGSINRMYEIRITYNP
jgi:hypothetical protein